MSNHPQQNNEEIEVYTQKEVELLDKYQSFSNHNFDDSEIYDLILRYGNDDIKIKEELERMIKDLGRGEEFQWHEAKGKNKPRKNKEKTNEEKTYKNKKNKTKDENYYYEGKYEEGYENTYYDDKNYGYYDNYKKNSYGNKGYKKGYNYRRNYKGNYYQKNNYGSEAVEIDQTYFENKKENKTENISENTVSKEQMQKDLLEPKIETPEGNEAPEVKPIIEKETVKVEPKEEVKEENKTQNIRSKNKTKRENRKDKNKRNKREAKEIEVELKDEPIVKENEPIVKENETIKEEIKEEVPIVKETEPIKEEEEPLKDFEDDKSKEEEKKFDMPNNIFCESSSNYEFKPAETKEVKKPFVLDITHANCFTIEKEESPKKEEKKEENIKASTNSFMYSGNQPNVSPKNFNTPMQPNQGESNPTEFRGYVPMLVDPYYYQQYMMMVYQQQMSNQDKSKGSPMNQMNPSMNPMEFSYNNPQFQMPMYPYMYPYIGFPKMNDYQMGGQK
ncbi:MAG: hypothetical protein MJ252_02990 [archaeon]|nr:hypothetical protein [archaeon]